MAIPNISSLLIERERRNVSQFSGARPIHGIPTDNDYIFLSGEMQTGVEVEGFIFGRDIWGVGIFGTKTSVLGTKYGI